MIFVLFSLWFLFSFFVVTEFWVTTRFLQILLWESIFLGAGLALSGVSYQILGLDLVFPHLCITHKSISGQGTSFK